MTSGVGVAEPDMIAVPEGRFLMGEARKQTFVRLFHIERCPVSNREYQRFIEDAGVQPPPHWRNGAPPESRLDHPVVNVTFYEAQAYAEWAGKRLPLGWEWEKAARGEDGRLFAWGDAFDESRCNTLEGGVDDTTSCGRYPDGASPYGVLDLCGNVWEWALDKAPMLTTFRMLRGGSWFSPAQFARCESINWLSPEYRQPDVGFRCVKSDYTPRLA